MNKSPILAGVLSILALSSFAQGASAPAAHTETQWEKSHPRRDQVNDRLANQNKRIKQEVAEGEMSKAKAAKLHKEDRQIRQEERDMAAQNGGHITKAEQKVLNQQENKVSNQIGK
jgi:TolA-binding protein